MVEIVRSFSHIYNFLMANTTFAPPIPRPPIRVVECDKGRASFCPRSKPYCGISCSQLIVGGIIPYRNANSAVHSLKLDTIARYSGKKFFYKLVDDACL